METRPPKIRSMTPEEVLAFFAYQHRVCAAHHEADPDAVITFDMTLQQWHDANLSDFVGWRELGRGLNKQSDTHFSAEQWHQVLKPARSKTLGGVCELIASQARVECIEPITVLGKSCLAAGAFLTIRSILARAGADVSNLTPSTPLAPFLREWLTTFILAVAKLAPEKLPVVRFEKPLYDASLTLFALSGLLGTMTAGVIALLFELAPAWLRASPLLTFLSDTWLLLLVLYGMLAVAGHVGMWIAARSPPRHAELEGLWDFRDLCYAIVGDPETH